MWRFPHAAMVSARWSVGKQEQDVGARGDVAGAACRQPAASRAEGHRTEDRIGAEKEIGRMRVVIGKVSANGFFSRRAKLLGVVPRGDVPILAAADYPVVQHDVLLRLRRKGGPEESGRTVTNGME